LGGKVRMQFSIIRLSEQEPISLRLDAEYYRPIFLKTEKQLKRGNWDYLENLSKSLKSFGAYSLCNQVEYKENGIPFLRCKDIKSGFIDFSDVLYIDSDANKLLWKSEIKPKTVLFTMSGTVGNSAIATEEIKYPINSNQDIAKITTNEKLNPYYFSIFLQSSYGKKQISRLPVGSVQQHIFLWQLEKLIVPLFGDVFQSNLESILKLALSLKKKSSDVYTQSKNILVSELGLADWKPKHKLSFIKNHSETKQSERIDAEYYQPKYDELIEAIKGYSGGWDTLGELVTVKKCVEVGSAEYLDEGIPFIRVSNLSPFEISQEKCISKNLYAEIKQHQPQKGEILFSKDATPGIAFYFDEEPSKMIPSGGILRLKNKTDKINNEYLTLVLNSLLTKEQVNRDVGGSVILHWRPDQVKETVIPILSEKKQAKIQQKVTDSFALRKQSKHLLECAKKAVEMAIEKNEKTAMDWLESQVP
jgi:type I restriction enzyme, S subunit